MLGRSSSTVATTAPWKISSWRSKETMQGSPSLPNRAVDAAEDAESKSEAECLDVFCRKANIGGTILVGEGYKNLFKYNASQPLARNPEVVLDTAHRTDDWDDTRCDATPNLLLLDKGDPRGDVEFGFEEEIQHRTRHQETTWREVIGAGAGRREQTTDLSTVVKDATPALQLLKSLSTLARNHPITGRTCGFALCGRFLRMFVSDSLSFATTLLCDLADPDHAVDIAKIIAFFTGPKENIIDTFEPPKKSFKIRPPGSEMIEEWHWSNSPESPKNTPLANPPWKMLEVRNQLWGRRTAVFAGYARKGNEGPETDIPIVMKCAWLPAYLKDYERRILEHIQKALQESDNHEKYPGLEEALEFVDPRVIKCIPRSLGAVQDCERVSRSVLPVEGIEDEDEIEPIEPDEYGLMRLEFSVLCTTGPHGERVPTQEGSKLSLKNHCEIQCGIIETLLIVSCCHVHYRDLNTGNILFVVHPIPADGMQGTTSKTTGKITGNVTGYLIDYGNARILSKRRKRLPLIFLDMDDHNAWLALDDARSINAHFICTPMLQVWELASEYRYQTELVRSKEIGMRSTHPGLVKIAKETRQRAIDEQKSITEQIKDRPHRFIDDMESALYVHIFQVGKIVGSAWGQSAKVFNLHHRKTKERAWQNSCDEVMKELNLDVTAWLYLEWKHVRDIVKTRDAIGTRKLGEELDREEFHCFLRRVTAVREALPGIPDEMLRPGLSTNIEEPARDEPGSSSPAPESKRARLVG